MPGPVIDECTSPIRLFILETFEDFGDLALVECLLAIHHSGAHLDIRVDHPVHDSLEVSH